MELDDKWLGGWNDKNIFKVDTGQWPWEIEEAAKIVKSVHPKTILEIGCMFGGTLLYWLNCLENVENACVIGIEPWMDRVRETVSDPRLVLVEATSQSGLAFKEVLRFGSLDALFIDGDHQYDTVKHDFDVYGDFVRKGGVILLHDIVTFSERVGVPQMWNEIKASGKYRTEEIIGKHTEEISGGGIGVVYK